MASRKTRRSFFQWDEHNTSHIADHDVTPEEAEQVVASDPLELEEQSDEGEERLRLLGKTSKGRLLIVVTTLRSGLIRVVTAYPAPRWMKHLFAAFKGMAKDDAS